jgi:hypothetical protein
VQVDGFNTRVESAHGVCNLRLKLYYDGLLSTAAFKSNVRRYILVGIMRRGPGGAGGGAGDGAASAAVLDTAAAAAWRLAAADGTSPAAAAGTAALIRR